MKKRLAKDLIFFSDKPFEKNHKQTVLEDYFERKKYDCYICKANPKKPVRIDK
jgi:hypothetical protein